VSARFVLSTIFVLLVSACAFAADVAQEVRDKEAAVAKAPNDAAALCELASAYRKAARLDDSAAAARRAIAADPKSAEAHHQLALTLKEKGEFAKAIAEWDAALALDATFYKAPYNIGVTHHDWADQLIAESEDLKAKRRRQEAADKLKEAEDHIAQAKAAWEATLKLKADHAGATFNLGVVEHEHDRFAEAEVLYRKAIALDPKHVKAHVNCGLCLAQLKRGDEALDMWKKALAIDPKVFEAHYNIGVVLSQKKQNKEAIAAWEIAAGILEPQKKDVEASKNARAIGSFKENLSNCYYNMGIAYEALADKKRAEEYLKKATDVDPNFDEASQALRALQRGN
jgi:tetratricopeptide (TPR) repeat protein